MCTLGDKYPSRTSLLKCDHLEGLVDFPRRMLRASLFSEMWPESPWDPSLPSQFFYTKCLILKLKIMLLLNFLFSFHVNLLLKDLCSSLCGNQAKRHNQAKDSRRKDILLAAIKNNENLNQSSVSPTEKVGIMFFLFWFGGEGLC